MDFSKYGYKPKASCDSCEFYEYDEMTDTYSCNLSLDEDEMVEFLNVCLQKAGADSMITPREMLRDYMTVLNILMQNPEVSFETVVGSAVTLKTEAQLEEEREREATPAPNKVTIDDIDF